MATFVILLDERDFFFNMNRVYDRLSCFVERL